MTAENTQGKTNIYYVYLEMVLNKEAKYDVISGLFKGIMEVGGNTLVLLHGLKNSTDVLNLKYYNIMSIEERTGDYKNMLYLQAEANDQNTALSTLQTMYKELIAAGRGLINDGKIIDVNKYTNVPKEFLEGKPIGGTAGTGGNGVGNFSNPGTRYVATGSNYTKQPVIKKDPEPFIIKRTKNKKPTKAMLALMEEKIQQIREGTFEQELPEILGADAAGANDDKEDDFQDIYGAGGCMC
jgi:hypothetical protein